MKEDYRKKKADGAVLDASFAGGEMQTTAEGLKIPVPAEDQFFKNLEKAGRKKDWRIAVGRENEHESKSHPFAGCLGCKRTEH